MIGRGRLLGEFDWCSVLVVLTCLCSFIIISPNAVRLIFISFFTESVGTSNLYRR